VRELRRYTTATFRVDANTAWTVEQTLTIAPELKSLGVEFIEQPLIKTRLLHWIHTASFIPLVMTGLVLYLPLLMPLTQGEAGIWMRLVHRSLRLRRHDVASRNQNCPCMRPLQGEA
jgi:hypothetical protein